MRWSELQKCVYTLYVPDAVNLLRRWKLIDIWQWNKSSSWNESSRVFSPSPLWQKIMWSHITQILWHLHHTHNPCLFANPTFNSPFILVPLPSSDFYFWLSVLWLAGPLWSSRSPAVIFLWWWWITSVTAACSSQSLWTQLKSCISFTGQTWQEAEGI